MYKRQVHDHIEIEPSPIRNKILEIITSFEGRFTELDAEREHRLDKMESGDESETGGLKEVKVYIAAKRKLGVGDKMAGRHGNKGVVAKICLLYTSGRLPDARAIPRPSW